ncbi:hypothetical protein [Paludisphaera mucosa]|uniref:DUF2325 domain-containing protein n=1 Tax=Paludisphaera mucosa TaxID=3030827 RepID=A0ABT6F946_9BACT|nr:hypothetical protein [Paludisphaera mucosa]MDG3003910.1 hypothetical protein [Paludisphaera mucosa]
MNDDLTRAIQSLADRLVDQAGRDDAVRADVRALATAILEATERPPATPAVATAAPEPPAAPVPLIELTLGRTPPPPARLDPVVSLAADRGTADEDLPGVEARCRLKADGLRWAASRRRLMDGGADFALEIAPSDREILDRARGLACFLWMNTPDFEVPADPSSLTVAAGCFEAVADAVSLVRGLLADESNRRYFEPALNLLAEAQSALRVVIDRIDGRKDPDQYATYDWLRGVAAREQIYIQRYMRIDDPAVPASHSGIRARIQKLDAGCQDVRRQAKKRNSLLSRLRYHARRVESELGDEYDWGKIFATLDDLVDEGEPPSRVEIREALLPILERMPDVDEPPRGLQMALREVDRYLAARRPATQEPEAPEPPTAEVVAAARLLAGKAVVLIGGARRPDAHDALRSALGLQELIWIETREHESIERFEHSVARPDVALVILAIRWSSHAFGEVKTFCDRYGKPLLRLPGGYNPNQVAKQVLDQCSGRLGDGRDGAEA